MDFVFKAFFLQFLVLGLLLQVVRPQTGGTDCRGKDYLCLDDVRFQLCVDYGDGRPVTVNDEVQQCPSGTFCSNGGHFECDSFVPPATTAAPQVGDVTENEPEAEEVTSSVPVEVEEATLPPVEEAAPEAGVPEPEEPAQEQVTTEAQVPEVPTTEAEAAPEEEENEELVTEAATERNLHETVEDETATTGVPVPEEVETEAATEEVVAPSTESSNPVVPEVTEGAPEPEQETEAPQEPEQDTTTVAVEATTTAAPEQEEQTEAATEETAETESSVATDAPVEEEEEEEEEVEEPVVTDAPATTENVEPEAPVEPSTTSAAVTEEEASEAAPQPTTDLPEEAPEEVTAPEAPETTPPVVTEEPGASESGSDEGESSGAAQESTEQPSAESGSNEAATTTTVAPSGDTPFLCTTAGRFPHPTDCHKYYICFWLPFGLYNLEQNCLAGFAYNPTLERCTADQSVCFPGQFTCTAPGRFPDPADPTKYFWCVWNAFGGYLQYGLQCPLGQVFNQFRGRCAFVVAGRSLDAEEPLLEEEESVGAEEDAVVPVEPVAPQEALPTKLKVKFECLEEGTFDDPNNCARYFVCTLKKLDKFKKSKFKCVTGERFDALVGACVPDLDALCE